MGCKRSGIYSDEIITVDVTAKYPKKELILQDFMDVEYIPLETKEDFLCQGVVLDIGKENILVRNSAMDGDIFIFDRSGRGLRKINRKGNSGEEYVYIHDIILDEDDDEIYVNDNSTKRILVYDLHGNFKKAIKHTENTRYKSIHNFDRECLIWWNSSFEYNADAVEMPSFFVTSKHDGSIIREIDIPFKQRKSTVLMSYDAETDMTYSIAPSYPSIIPYQNQFILVEPSSDTVYSYFPDHSMKPFLIRTPSIQSMKPEVFLFPGILTDNYYFMYISKKEDGDGDPDTDLIYDIQAKKIFECLVYNNDYSNKKRVSVRGKNVNDEIAFLSKLEAFELIEAYEKGQLKGKLKEIVAELDEEANPVIMLAKHKK